MELLLNLAWLALAPVAWIILVRRRRASGWQSRASYQTALLALACTLVLLFPIVSASDDLHPTQAVLEDATKRIQQMAGPLQHANPGSLSSAVLALLAVYLLPQLVVPQVWQSDAPAVRVISLSHTPLSGRSPPSL